MPADKRRDFQTVNCSHGCLCRKSENARGHSSVLGERRWRPCTNHLRSPGRTHSDYRRSRHRSQIDKPWWSRSRDIDRGLGAGRGPCRDPYPDPCRGPYPDPCPGPCSGRRPRFDHDPDCRVGRQRLLLGNFRL